MLSNLFGFIQLNRDGIYFSSKSRFIRELLAANEGSLRKPTADP